jgi:streptomycin 6-kinase
MTSTDMLPPTLPVLTGLSGIAAAQDWLRQLPELIEEVREAWQLTLRAPIHGGSCSWVAQAVRTDGTHAIVKIGWPHREMYGEPVALRAWADRSAVLLYDHDPQRHALLLERCEPGTPLATHDDGAGQRLRYACAVLRDLWGAPPVPGLEDVAAVMAEWAGLAEERMERLRPPYDAGLVAYGVDLLRTLPMSAGRTVVLHGDANPGNILAARRRPWLAIDPKPMLGDPAYDPWPLLGQVDDPFAYPRPVSVLRDRIALLADELELDAARIAAWCIARAVEVALYNAHHGDPVEGAAEMRAARAVADAYG